MDEEKQIRQQVDQLVKNLWPNKRRDKAQRFQWMVAHIGRPYSKTLPLESVKRLHFLLTIRAEQGHCPIPHKRHAERRRERLGRDWSYNRALLINVKGNTCSNCGKNNLQGSDLTVDHITPLSQGGTSDIANLQILCAKCHREKTVGQKESKKAWLHFKDSGALEAQQQEINDYFKELSNV